MRTSKLIMIAIVALSSLSVPSAQGIENVRGKQYHLTPKHGPWMIMVTSFSDVRSQDMKKDGLTAEQAASELVFELREKGIPAYTYSQDFVKGKIDTRDRLGRDDSRIYAAQRDMICVLAGNYGSIEDQIGQKTLKGVKAFRPKFLKDSKSGAILRADATQRGPLSGAFMTINPLIKPEDIVQRSVDKETRELNVQVQYSLVRNPHKYTVRVATFSGRSATPLGNSSFNDKASIFDLNLKEKARILDRAGEDAANLTAFIRDPGGRLIATGQKVKPLGSTNQFADSGISEAYVFHDKFQSIVTIGGFDSPDDPRIRMIGQYYGQKLIPDTRLLSTTKRTFAERQAVTEEELAKLPTVLTTHTEQLFPAGSDPLQTPPLQIWTFDTELKVILVPRIK